MNKQPVVRDPKTGLVIPQRKNKKEKEIKFHGFILGGKMYKIMDGDLSKMGLTVKLVMVCAKIPWKQPDPKPFPMINPEISGATRFQFFKEIKIYK